MAFDHYVPASLLGRFSAEERPAARDRRIAIGRDGRVFESRAGKFGAVNDLYAVSRALFPQPGRTSVDGPINGYEADLPGAIDALEAGLPLDLNRWLRTLVPFVAATFVRGHDFAERFESRAVVRHSGLSSRDNTNGARLLELQRLLAPVMCARWVVLRSDGRRSFIMNDLAVSGTIDSRTGEPGYVLPLSRRAILGLFPRQEGVVAFHDGDCWHAPIHYLPTMATEREVDAFNTDLAKAATSWIAGQDKEAVERYLAFIHQMDLPAAALMEGWGFPPHALVAHEMEWHRLVTAAALNLSPSDPINFDVINWDKLALGWCPALILTVNRTVEITGLNHRGQIIGLTMDLPRHYAAHTWSGHKQ